MLHTTNTRSEGYKTFEVYEDAVNLIGVAKVTLPDIPFQTTSVEGGGLTGTVEAPIMGIMQSMTLSLNFQSYTDTATRLSAPIEHRIELHYPEQFWDYLKHQKGQWADKIVLIIVPKSTKIGTVAPNTISDASGEYSVYYYAGYRDGELLWEIDPFNYICTIYGVDYLADTRKAVGKI